MICFANHSVRDELVLANLGLSYFVAQRLCKVNPVVQAMGYDEAVSFCQEHLVTFAEQFEPDRGTFSTFYVTYMQKRLVKEASRIHAARSYSLIDESVVGPESDSPFDVERVPAMLAILRDREREIIERFYGLNGRPQQNGAEIGAALDISRQRIYQIMDVGMRRIRAAGMLPKTT
jgi:DNA-directed RNA polymerase specialized sigma subunit